MKKSNVHSEPRDQITPMTAPAPNKHVAVITPPINTANAAARSNVTLAQTSAVLEKVLWTHQSG
jgi:hypothetical protein